MRHTLSPGPRRAMVRVPILLMCLLLASTTSVAAKPPVPSANPAVITTWNAITVSTVSGAATSPTHFLYYAFTHLAMYNAVVGITGEYELYRWDKHGRRVPPRRPRPPPRHTAC